MSALVLAARRYLGVRFVHRGRLPHKLDCVGLVRISYLDCGVELEDFTLYGRDPDISKFQPAMERNLGPPIRPPMRVADVVAMRTLRHPHHLAIVTDHPDGLGLIHASGEHGRVVEHRLDPSYLRRITHIYRRLV